MSINLVMPSNHLILCCPLLLLPSIFPSIRVFSSESVLRIRWPKYWSLSISPSNEYSGLISFRIDWFDLLAVQGTLKSVLQHHSSKASILQCSAFFIIQLAHPYTTTGKTIALTRWTFVGKVISLFFFSVNNLVFYLPKASCCRHWGPKTSRRDGGGGGPSCLPSAACPILLPTGDGRVDKVYPCIIKHLNFVYVSVTQLCLTLWLHGV